jgi:peptidoglycan/LPS O-acetylase OafA/YrhL
MLTNNFVLTTLTVSSAENGKTRAFGLDLARAAAILLVLVAHSSHLWGPYFQSMGIDVARTSLLAGVEGVELFFCLSGFLIGGLLLEIDSRGGSASAVKIFLIRRWMRTLPLYYLTLAFFRFFNLSLVYPSASGLTCYWPKIFSPPCREQIGSERHGL